MASNVSGHRASIRRASSRIKRSLSLIPKKSVVQNPSQPNRILINVGGIRFETYRSTLKAIPDTRLFWLTGATSQTAADYDPVTGEYFFDRHPGMFNMILNYYRTGKLHVPTDVCGPIFEEELAFWGIDENQIEACCWTLYRSHRDAQETLKELDIHNNLSVTEENEEEDRYIAERFGIETGDHKAVPNYWQRLRPRAWTLLEEPNSSRGAKVVAIISLLIVLLSITNFCLESHVTFRVPRNASDPISPHWTIWEKNLKSTPVKGIIILEYVCVFFFTIEFLIRLIFSEDKREFFKNVMNWVDIWAVLPFYVDRIITGVNPALEYTIYMQVLKSMDLIRIFKIFKLTRHFSGLKILWKAIKASAKELMLLIVFLFISVVIFACLVYYAESIQEATINDFQNIPLGFWWAVVTMTTLGYGDMYPRTGFGYLVGVVCSICGVLVLALPVPVIVNNFSLYYSHAQAQMKLPKKHNRILAGVPDDLKVDFSVDDVSEETTEQGEESGKTSISSLEPCATPDEGDGHRMEQQTSKDSITDASDDSDHLADISVPGRRQPRRGISVMFVNETNSPRHSTKRRTFKRKVSPIPEIPVHTISTDSTTEARPELGCTPEEKSAQGLHAESHSSDSESTGRKSDMEISATNHAETQMESQPIIMNGIISKNITTSPKATTMNGHVT